MTKQELAREIRDKTGVELAVVVRVIESMMSVVGNQLESGESVVLRGFGSFHVRHRAEKVARDMSRGRTMVIPAHNLPVFRPSKALVDKVREAGKKQK